MKKPQPKPGQAKAPFLKSIGKLFGFDTDAAKKESLRQAEDLRARAEAERQAASVQAQALRLQQNEMQKREALAERAKVLLADQPAVDAVEVSVGTSGQEATESRQRRRTFFTGSASTGLRI